MNRRTRWLGLGGLALAVMLLLTLLLAPHSSQSSGSTYSRAPDGYGAWYAYMQEQKQPIQRWQRPLSDLWPDLENQPDLPPVQQVTQRTNSLLAKPITLLRVDGAGRTGDINRSWLERGNRLVLVGAIAPVSDAPFESALESPVGAVKIATSRRYRSGSLTPDEVQLADRFGAVVWQEQVGRGEIISVATQHLAANAYQDAPGNFKFLAQLVAESRHPIYIDEFLHGYRDKAATQKTAQSLPQYLAKTPLLLLAVQALVLTLALIWGEQRFGRPQPLIEPSPNNSQAYISAMAEVLQKANSGDFVVQTIGRAEQLRLQQALGLGRVLLEPQVVFDAWVQRTGRPASELDWLNSLDSRESKRRILRWRDPDLRGWLVQLQTTQRQLDRLE